MASTRGRTRTGTSLRTMDFKSIVSTNSTTRALKNDEASAGFEPANNGFANRPLKPLGYDAIKGNLSSKLTKMIIRTFRNIRIFPINPVEKLG